MKAEFSRTEAIEIILDCLPPGVDKVYDLECDIDEECDSVFWYASVLFNDGTEARVNMPEHWPEGIHVEYDPRYF